MKGAKKEKKRNKKYRPKHSEFPALPIDTKNRNDLALQLHCSALMLTHEDGLNRFCKILSLVTLAMEHSKTHDKQSRAILSTSLQKLQRVVKTDEIKQDDIDYLKLVASNIHDYLEQGRINWQGFLYAKRYLQLPESM